MRNTGGFSRVGSPVIRQRDSALPDPPPSAKGPIAAIETDNIAAFARDLRVLRSKAGLDYPDMAEKSHYTMRTLASAAGGLQAADAAGAHRLRQRLRRRRRRVGRTLGQADQGREEGRTRRFPAGDQEAGGQPDQGRIPQGARQTGEIYVITSARQRDAQW